MTAIEEEMPEKEEVRLAFTPLRERLRTLQRGLNPSDENLDFATTTTAQQQDFEVLGCIGTEALEVTRRYWNHFLDNPYGGRMFWYDFLLLSNAAARSRLGRQACEPIADDAIERLLTIILDVSEFMVMGGDSSSRCREAIGNIRLAFPQQSFRDQLARRATTAHSPHLAGFLEWVLGRVRDVEERRGRTP